MKRYKYCDHKEDRVAQERPVITWPDLERAWVEVHSKTEIAWDSYIEHFEAEQPGLRSLLFDLRWPLGKEAHSQWQLQTFTVWQAFRTCNPWLRPITIQEILSLMPLLQPEFVRQEICLCTHYQMPAMLGSITRLEHAMNQKELTVMEGNQLIKNMVLIIEALDRFGTAMEPPDTVAGQNQGKDMLDSEAGEEGKQN